MRLQTCCLFLAITFGVDLPEVWCVTITIPASKDTSIFQNNANNSSGAGNALFAGTNGTGSPRRAFIAFDVAGNIPAGATVTEVQLILLLGQVAGSGSGGGGGISMVELHRLLADWGEGIAQKQNPSNDSFVGLGQGAAAGIGDATWRARVYPTTPWSKPGGDFVAEASAAVAVGGVLNSAWVWGSTTSLVGDVQGWLSSPATNFGWAIVNADETVTTNFRAFYSRDTATDAFRPQLQITYGATNLVGDFSRDGDVNGNDIQSMVAALADLPTYQLTHQLSDSALLTLGDLDKNNLVTNADLQALLIALKSGGGSAAPVVEPASTPLIAIGVLMLLAKKALVV